LVRREITRHFAVPKHRPTPSYNRAAFPHLL
jgi:hypothetical protein